MKRIKTMRGWLLPVWLLGGAAELAAGDFSTCIARLQQQAGDRGFSASSVDRLGQVSEIERTIELDRSQPEFVQTFANYLNQRVTNGRIKRGRDLLAEYRPLLDSLTVKYGVPPQYLVSFWGLESNFGRYMGKIPILDTLTTLACDDRRGQYFTSELFSALELMETQGVDVDQMQGSWAGAIGQTQFMPSAYNRYGLDGDGDGRIDLWGSTEDALTSAAHFLNQLGWVRNYRWGREVKLPGDFPYEMTGLKNRQPLSYWREQGVTAVSGTRVADLDIEAALLVPSGEDGPKFLVYENFDVIMKWNRSQFYALAVGNLADRINGADELYTIPPDEKGLTRDQIETIQNGLHQLGFDPGTVDGQPGPATASAIRDYQKSIGAVADGYPDPALLQSITDSLAGDG